MGGKRAPFHVRSRPGSPFWQFSTVIDGQKIRESLTTRVEEDPNQRKAGPEAGARYLHHCARIGAKAEAGAVETDTLRLLEQYVDTELAARARKRSDKYLETEETRLIRHVVPRFPTVDAITTRAWELAQAEIHAKGVKLATIQRVTVSLRMFLRYCAQIGAIAAAPTLTAPSGQEAASEASERRPFTEAERGAFLDAVGKLDPRAHRIYTTLLYTALRKGALEKLLPRWINWSTAYVTYPAGSLKNGKARSFYLHPLAQRAIKEELATRGDLRQDEPVFGSFDYDGHNSAKGRLGLFWTACRMAKIPLLDLTAHHVTRHTACTIAGNNGASLAELMALGGWETPAMACRYLHIDAKQSRAAVDRL